MNKYRIWNSTLNCWVSDYCKNPGENEIQYFVDPVGKLRKFVRTLSDGGIFIEDVLLDNYVVQFFTGLYDVDNNPICEGDVIDFTAKYKQDGPTEVIFWGSSYGCIIKDEGGLNEYWGLDNIVSQYFPKIVGNICENSNLLKT
jgi:hypothetical protein